jgi:hypothetical protein
MIVNFSFTIHLRSPFVFDDHLYFRLIQWNPSSAPAGQPVPDDSSESDRYSPVPYRELDALRFKAELEVAQRELEDVSKSSHSNSAMPAFLETSSSSRWATSSSALKRRASSSP